MDVVVERRSGAKELHQVAWRRTSDPSKSRNDVRDLGLAFLERRGTGDEKDGDRYVFVSNIVGEHTERDLRHEIRREWSEGTEADRDAFLDRLEFVPFEGDGGVRGLLAAPPLVLAPCEIDEVLRVLSAFARVGKGAETSPIRVRDVLVRLQNEGVAPAIQLPPDDPLGTAREGWWVDRSALESRLDDLVASPGPVLVTGAAGAGKSTFVDGWVRKHNEREPGSARRMPAAFFDDQQAVNRLADRVLRFGRRGGRVFVVDGLDELWDPNAQRRARDFIDAVAPVESPRLVVVARPSDAERLRSPLGPEWTLLEVPELTDEELECVRARMNGLLDPLADHPRDRDLVRNPFRLRLLVLMLRKEGAAVWRSLDAVAGPTEFLGEYWARVVEHDAAGREVHLERALLRLAHRMAADGVDRIRPLAVDVEIGRCGERAKSLGILANARDLFFSSRIFRDFALALAFRDGIDESNGLEWLRSTLDEAAKVIVLRHWVGIEWWHAKRERDWSRARETWVELVASLPANLAAEATDALMLLVDRDRVRSVFGWTNEIDDPSRRRECRAWMVRRRVMLLEDEARRDVELDAALIDAAISLGVDGPYAEIVELAHRSVETADPADRTALVGPVLRLFDRLASRRELESAERSRRLGRLFHAFVRTAGDDGESLRARLNVLDVGDPSLAHRVLDDLTLVAELQPETAAELWERCVEAHAETSSRDGVFWSADRQLEHLLERAAGAMACAVIRVFESEGRREDASHDEAVRRASKELGVEPGEERWEAEVLDRDLCRWLEAVGRHAPAMTALAAGAGSIEPMNTRSQVRAALFAGAVAAMGPADEETRRALDRFARPLVTGLKETEPPSSRETVGRALLAAAEVESSRAWASDVARALAERLPSVVVHLRVASDEECRQIGENAASSRGRVRPSFEVTGGAGPPPSDEVYLRQMDDAEELDRSTDAYRATLGGRLRLIADLPRIDGGTIDFENVCALENAWSSMDDTNDAKLRAKLERELAAAAEKLASFGTLELDVAEWVRRFLLEHAASRIDHSPRDVAPGDHLETLSTGTRARCARGLLAIARVRELTGAELERIEALASDPSPHVRVEVARAVPALRERHASTMWRIAAGIASSEGGHAGSAIVVWLLWAMEPTLFADPVHATEILRNVWRRRSHWTAVGSLGRPQSVVAEIVPRLVAYSGLEETGRLLAELRRQLHDPTVCQALARGVSTMLEDAVGHPGALDVARAGAVFIEFVRDVYGGSRSETLEHALSDGALSELIVGLIRVIRTDGASGRIPGAVWTSLADSPPDFGPRVVRNLIWLADEVLSSDPERALELSELAILREDRDRLDPERAGATSSRVVRLAETIWRPGSGDERTKRRILRLLGAYTRFQIDSVRLVRDRILRNDRAAGG